MKYLLTVIIATVLTSMAHAAPTVGYVDIQKAIQSSKLGKKAKETLQVEADKKNKELDKKKTDVEKMREDLEKKRSVMSEEALKKKEVEVQEEMLKWNQAASKAQADLQKKEAELLAPIVEKIKKTVEKLAKEKNMSMVIQSNQNAQIVLYASAESDLTDAVIKAFDSEK